MRCVRLLPAAILRRNKTVQIGRTVVSNCDSSNLSDLTSSPGAAYGVSGLPPGRPKSARSLSGGGELPGSAGTRSGPGYGTSGRAQVPAQAFASFQEHAHAAELLVALLQ